MPSPAEQKPLSIADLTLPDAEKNKQKKNKKVSVHSQHKLKQQRPLTLPRHQQILQKLLADLQLRPRVPPPESVRMPRVTVIEDGHDLRHMVRPHVAGGRIHGLPAESEQRAGIRVAEAQHLLREHDLPLRVPQHGAGVEARGAGGERAADHRAVGGSPFETGRPARGQLQVGVVVALDEVGRGGRGGPCRPAMVSSLVADDGRR